MTNEHIEEQTSDRLTLRKAAIQLASAINGNDGMGVDRAWDELSRAMRGMLSGGRQLVEEEDLAALWDAAADLPQPTMGLREDGAALLYDGKIHWLAGEPGGGKTWVALFWTLEQVRVGNSVLYIDMESDPITITSRLRTLGIEQDQLTRVRYLRVRWEPGNLATAVEQIADRVLTHTPSLVVMDGMASALAQLGKDENSNSDVSAFTGAVLRPIADHGPAVVVVDHMSKPQGEQRGPSRYARGASAKLADASGVAYVLETVTPFSRSKDGLAKLRIGKDRNGAVGAAGEVASEIHFSTAGEGMVISVRKPSPGQSSGRWIPSGLMEKLSIALIAAPDKSLRTGEVSEALGTKNWEKYGAKVRELLVKYNYIKVEKDGKATVFTSLKAFSEDEDAETIRESEFGPDNGPSSKNPF
jgi:KaiC/GvpD/RAD55 family RecA-like ATPase